MDIYRGPEFHLKHQSKLQSDYLLRWYDCTQLPNQVMTLVTKLFQQEQYAILYQDITVVHNTTPRDDANKRALHYRVQHIRTHCNPHTPWKWVWLDCIPYALLFHMCYYSGVASNIAGWLHSYIQFLNSQ